MRAHIIEDGIVVNTIEVESLDFMPNLIDASQGGQIGDSWDGVSFSKKSIDLSELRISGLKNIDADVDKIYADVIGNRGTEYAEAEREALDFRAASYAGQVPPTVQSWATVKNWSAQVAADDIIAQANAWRNAALSIRANRLKEKEAVRVATTIGEINAAQARWAGFRAGIRSALGIGV